MKALALLLLLAGPARAGIISGGSGSGGVSASSAAATYVNKAGDTMTGLLTAPYLAATYNLDASSLTLVDDIAFSGFDPHITANTADGADISSITISGGGNGSANINHFIRGGALRVFGNESVSNPGDAIIQAGTVTGGEVRLMTGSADRLVVGQDGNVTIGQGVSAATGSFSGSVTASSVTSQGDFSVGVSTFACKDGRCAIGTVSGVAQQGYHLLDLNTTGIGGSAGFGLRLRGANGTQPSIVVGMTNVASADWDLRNISGDFQLNMGTAGNAVYVKNSNGSVGIGTDSPATTLDVNGNAQFGSGATKSTFTATGFWEPISKTKAEIDTLVPTKAGQVIYASDTTLPGLCVSTGTLAAQWRKMESATLGCGTNN